jgi:CubicO group peptidase (beta-lactamase class C family)
MIMVSAKRRLLWTALLMSATHVCIPAGVSSDDIDAVQRIIADPKGIAAPGCAVGAFRDGKTIFFTASGAADIATRRPLSEHTRFYAASISKQFTALAVAKLVESQKLGLDDDVRRWIPELPVYDAPVTVRMLMHHTAGIRDWLDLVKLLAVHDAGEFGRGAAIKLLAKQSKTLFTPGSQFKYSNGGYLLLSEVVARASGMPFHEFARRAIFEPLGMRDSYFLAGIRPGGDQVAHGYVPLGKGFELRDTYPTTGGSGGMITTIADLALYDHDMQKHHKVWSRAAAGVMLTPAALSDGTLALSLGKLGYAGGLGVGLRAGRYVIMHGGSAEGFRGNYVSLPDRHLSVALICNRGDVDPVEKTDAIVDLLEGTAFSAESATRKTSRDAANAKAVELVAAPGAATGLLGTYLCDDLDATYELTAAGSAVAVTVLATSWWDAGDPRLALNLAIQRDGSLKDHRYRFVPDSDEKGFTIESRGISGLQCRRVDVQRSMATPRPAK